MSLLILAASGQKSVFCAERPYYEAPADYREQINKLKEKFKNDYGYELRDLDEGWKSEDINTFDKIFSELPPTFYRLPGLNGFYRTESLDAPAEQGEVENIPAAFFPSFTTIYRNLGATYNVYVDEEDPRIEFYNGLQYESFDDQVNIVQHEMGHAYDMLHGFLSFSAEWLAITHFRVINMPALDGRKDSDYLYALVNDVEKDVYAPVARRHLPTYSRQNPQEDFANSVTAYIHYPYFRYSDPARYNFLKDKVFGGREYFPAEPKNYDDKVLSDLDQAIAKNDWDAVIRIAIEVGRTYYPPLQAKIIARFKQAMPTVGDNALKMGVASCNFFDPDALELRQELVRSKKVVAEEFMHYENCARIGREMYENIQVLWTLSSVYFYREGDKNIIQFLDPAMLTSQSRGFESVYLWRLIYSDAPTKAPIAEGQLVVSRGNSAVKIDMDKSGKIALPEGVPLELQLGVRRQNIKTFKKFEAPTETVRFVYQPWFKYLVDSTPKIRIVYPLTPAFMGKQEHPAN